MLREGCETSSITTTLAAASVTKAMPATIAEVFDIGFDPSALLTRFTQDWRSMRGLFTTIGRQSANVRGQSPITTCAGISEAANRSSAGAISHPTNCTHYRLTLAGVRRSRLPL